MRVLLTNGPGSGMPDLGVRIPESIAEEVHAHADELGCLLDGQALHDAAEGKRGCLPASPVFWTCRFANVLLQCMTLMNALGPSTSPAFS